MLEILTMADLAISLIMLPLILVGMFKRGRDYVKYIWLAVAVLGTADLAIELYLGKATIDLVLSLVIVGFALLNTYSSSKPRKAG